jgi:tetratricopeptide (TPR) repeat protein
MIARKIFVLFLVGLFAACQSSVPEKTSADYSQALRVFYVGLAALQVGDDARAKEALTKATELAAAEPAAWANLGILQIRQKDFDSAAKSLEKARSLDEGNGQIYQTIALLETQRGNFEQAQTNWQKAIDLNAQNAKAVYALAKEKERQNEDQAARKLYEQVLQIKPDNLAAQIEVLRLAAKQNDAETLKKITTNIAARNIDWDAEIKTQFDALSQAASAGNARQTTAQIAFFRNVLLRSPAFRANLNEVKYSDTTLGDPFTKPLKLPTPDFTPAEPDMALAFSAQPSADVKAYLSKAIFLNGENAPVVLWSDGKATHVGKAALPFTSNFETTFYSHLPSSILAFDFDYDFKNDLAFATNKGFRLFKQIEGDNFADVTAETKLSNEVTQDRYTGVWTLDIESDGDLDLILGRLKDSPIVLQNNSDGTFQMIKIFEKAFGLLQFVAADVDEDGDADCFIINESGVVKYFSNERGGLFIERETPQGDNPKTGIEIADINGDGKLDLLALQNNGTLWRISDKNNGRDWETQQIPLTEEEICPRAEAGNTIRCQIKLSVQDFDNNGANDILLSNEKEAQLFLGGKETKFSPLNKINAQISSFAETNGDGRLDLIGINAEGKPTIYLNQSAKKYNFQTIRPRASKTTGDQRVNSYGIGGEMEIRAGLSVQKQIIAAPQVHFGLGDKASVDVLRVVWQNGYIQAEFDLQPNQTIAAEQRLKGSCPHLFAWNGEEFKLVKDAPPWSPALGLKINAQDTYGILQTEEWFKIPGDALKPTKENFYELRITGEYWESFYIDQYSLLVVDHPEETEVFTDERFSIPLPPLKVFTTEQTKEFAAAKTDKGADASQIVKSLDEKYLDGFERGTFQGVAKDHYVELELPEDAPPDKKIWIVGDGWIHPTDASINVQLGQSGQEKPRSLSLEIQDETGNWKIAKENLGFPAGKMKTVLIDLPPGAKCFRLRTNMEIFWDKLAWATDIEASANDTSRLEVNSAELRYRGFSVIEKADDSSPEKPDYSKILTTAQRWRDLEGYYTRFGDIKELLTQTDDRYVLANAGDEIVLKFPALPLVAAGYKRDYVLIGNGWIKDGDLNSVFSKTLLPLPTHQTNDYSTAPTVLENDPVYQKRKDDWTKFHTRYVVPDAFRNALR